MLAWPRRYPRRVTTRITTTGPIVFEVPDGALSVAAGQPFVDLGALPPSADVAAEIAAAEAAAVDATTLAPQVLVVRTAADLPAAIAGVRTIPDDAGVWLLDHVDVGSDVLECGDRACFFGLGASISSLRTSAAGPAVTGRSLLMRDLAVVNLAGPCVRAAGASAADPAGLLRVNGCAFTGNSADGVVQAHDIDLFAAMFCAWRSSGGVGLRVTGECGTVYAAASTALGNAAGFTWAEVPGAAAVRQRMLLDSVEFDLAGGGVGVRADPSAFGPESLHMESCLFPDPSTPGVGTPTELVTADSPECHWGANNNLENTHVRGGISIANNAVATTVSNTTAYFHLAGATTLSEAVLFDSPSAGRLRYTGTGTIRVKLTAFVTLVTAGPNQNLQVLFALTPAGGGGATDVTAFVQEDVTDGTTLRTGIMPLMAWVTMSQGDQVDVRVRNLTGANDVTWRHGQVYAEQING